MIANKRVSQKTITQKIKNSEMPLLNFSCSFFTGRRLFLPSNKHSNLYIRKYFVRREIYLEILTVLHILSPHPRI
jgi:hypothetical protein